MKKILRRKISGIALFAISLSVIVFFASFYFMFVDELHPVFVTRYFDESNDFYDVAPNEPLRFEFSEPVLKQDIVDSFYVSNTSKGRLVFEHDFFGAYSYSFVYYPDEVLAPDSFYTVGFGDLNSFFGSHFDSTSYTFQTVAPPHISSVEMTDPESSSVMPHIIVELDKESDYFDYNFALSHNTALEVVENEENRFVLVPKTQLAQGASYDLFIERSYVLDSDVFNEEKAYTFKTHNPVVITEYSPQNGADRVKPNSEISITFNTHVDYKTVDERFSISPQIDGDIGWEGTTMVFVPHGEFEPGVEYSVSLDSGVREYNGEGFLEEGIEMSFVSKRNEKEITPPEVVEPHYTDGRYIDVDLSGQFLTLFENGESQGSFQISSGRYDLPTPKGEFSIINKKPLGYSREYDLYMPFWMAFTYQGHGFHELPFWKYKSGAEYKERESHLGTQVSHGCVRLGVGPAEEVYHFSEVGTRIYIHD